MIKELIKRLEKAIKQDEEMQHNCKRFNEDCAGCQVDKAITVLKSIYETN